MCTTIAVKAPRSFTLINLHEHKVKKNMCVLACTLLSSVEFFLHTTHYTQKKPTQRIKKKLIHICIEKKRANQLNAYCCQMFTNL